MSGRFRTVVIDTQHISETIDRMLALADDMDAGRLNTPPGDSLRAFATGLMMGMQQVGWRSNGPIRKAEP